jgi:hypothetical protein
MFLGLCAVCLLGNLHLREPRLCVHDLEIFMIREIFSFMKIFGETFAVLF